MVPGAKRRGVSRAAGPATIEAPDAALRALTMTPTRRLKLALSGGLLAAFFGALHGQMVSETAVGRMDLAGEVAARQVGPDASGDPRAVP